MQSHNSTSFSSGPVGASNEGTSLPNDGNVIAPPQIDAGSADSVTNNSAQDVYTRFVADLAGPEGAPSSTSAGTLGFDRPGVSSTTLEAAGVRSVTPGESSAALGYAEEGLLIPYRTLGGETFEVNGRAFARLRLKSPTAGGPKYLSPAKSGCHAYFPPGLKQLLKAGCVLGIVEGEFKAMALVEAGFPCVGIGGISSACPKDEAGNPQLLPALSAVIAEARPSRLAFIGDNDTALIPDFSREALKLAGLVSVPVVLPRIPLDAPGKGPDDLRSAWGSEFNAKWRRILEEAVSAGTASHSGLALKLLELEAGAFRLLPKERLPEAQRRLVKLAAAFRADHIALNAVIRFACEYAQFEVQAFRAAVKDEGRKQARAEAERGFKASLERFEAELAEGQVCFDGSAYWRKELDGNFGRICREDMKLHFNIHGLSLSGRDGGPSPADIALHRLQTERRVVFAGPICGRPAGMIEENGMKILVTRGPKFIEPKAGQCPTITSLIANLLGKAAGDELAETQATALIGWLNRARRAVADPDTHLPGQVLALVGPKDCGKSLFLSAIVTPALGGRVADPSSFLLGKTTFNADLWGAEHLAIDDKGLGEDGRERAKLRDELKRITAENVYSLHPKHRDAITLRHVWRVTLAANNDPESASSLPSLEASFGDKIIYLKCYAPPKPFFDEREPGARAAFAAALAAELPAFLALVDAFEIPPEWRKARFGVKEFHHPEILDLIEASSPLAPLAEVIDSWINTWDLGRHSAQHSTVELYGLLDDYIEGRLKPISSGPPHLTKQLSKLAEAEGWSGRILRCRRRIGGRDRNQQQTVWEIRRGGV